MKNYLKIMGLAVTVMGTHLEVKSAQSLVRAFEEVAPLARRTVASIIRSEPAKLIEGFESCVTIDKKIRENWVSKLDGADPVKRHILNLSGSAVRVREMIAKREKDRRADFVRTFISSSIAREMRSYMDEIRALKTLEPEKYDREECRAVFESAEEIASILALDAPPAIDESERR
jgi:hypothetical protein